MIARRFATARELVLATALALAVFGPSLALAQDDSRSAEADGCGPSRCVSGGDGQPTDPGLDEAPVDITAHGNAVRVPDVFLPADVTELQWFGRRFCVVPHRGDRYTCSDTWRSAVATVNK